MIPSLVARLVDGSRRFATWVVVLAIVVTGLLGGYVATHIKINTDINQLLAEDLPWRQREKALEAAFPHKTDRLVVVIDGDTPDAAEDAAAKLTDKMTALTDTFHEVTRPDAIPFFRQNGLLYLSGDELRGILESLVQAQPLLGVIANDPSLRGLFGTMGLVLEGLQRGDVEYTQLDQPLARLAGTVEAALAGQEKPLPWRSLMAGGAASPRDLRKYILTKPVLDYSALAPGADARATVHRLAHDMNLTPEHGVRVRLTGPVALNDEEFASVAEGTEFATILSIVLVLALLFFALRSFRLILPILLTLTVGLIATTAFAMAAIGSLNLISVAFAVMFVGIAVDFGIQFGVRYRDQRHLEPNAIKALHETAMIVAIPLALAAGSTALGFLAFIPTDYRGVAELGLIAGVGMIIAFVLNITLLPALLTLFRPVPEPEDIGFLWAAPIDRFLQERRKDILLGALVVALASLGVATQLRFDFDPLNLKDPHTESVSTLFDLMRDPEASPYTIEILEPDLPAAKTLAARLAALPEVNHVMTLASFEPEEQTKKLTEIDDVRMLLGPTLNPLTTREAPSDEDIFAALSKAAAGLRALDETRTSARRLAEALDNVVARHDGALLRVLHGALIRGLSQQLTAVRESLMAAPVAADSITQDLRRDWITRDGRARVEVYPKGDARDPDVLRAFTDSVRQGAPEASGAPVSIHESGRTVVNAFIKAGIFALLAVGVLVGFVLRRTGDVLRLLAPLGLAGILTLATMAVLPLPLNFANIIALPLLLSLGVSYTIYFISHWRAGQSDPLQSSMARAVLFSAGTTLVAFGSLSLSSHPGTRGMGVLLTLALFYALVCTFFFLPALLGPPESNREKSVFTKPEDFVSPL